MTAPVSATLAPYPRPAGWQGRLNAYLAGLAGQPFVWGELDCGLMVAGAVKAMTGLDPAGPLRGTYHDAASLRACLAELGHADHIAYVASLWPACPPALVTTGDIVAVEGAMDLALGIVTGPVIRLMTPTGLSALPLVATDPDTGDIRPVILRAWRACGCA